mmetsp:Transcript_870/g.1809  ORF Transcript_870/g.1809 Transcript_870/m.1809 type:complete len:763 (-) Transcript_870:690-2978(-)
MKYWGIYSLSVYVLAAIALFSNQSTAEHHLLEKSEIKEVTIGVNTAEVERSLIVKGIPTGSHTIVVDNLPNTIDENSIKVSGLGDAVIVSTVVQNKVTPRTNDALYNENLVSLRAIDKAISDLSRNIDLQLKLSNARFAAVAQYVENLLSKPSKETTAAVPDRVSLQQLTETLDYQEKEQALSHSRQAELTALRGKVNELSGTLQNMLTALVTYGRYFNSISDQITNEVFAWPDRSEELSSTLSPLSAGLAEVGALVRALSKESHVFPPNKKSKELHINIHVPKAVEGGNTLELDLSYMASPASWQAEYDLRLEKVASQDKNEVMDQHYEMKVGLFAVVRQSTGEDWSDVRLHLSTSQAENYIHPPTPPMRLSLDFLPEKQHFMRKQEKMRPLSFSTPSSVQTEMAGATYAADDGMADADMATRSSAEVGVSGASVTGNSGQVGSPLVFHPEHPVNISSDARAAEHKMPRPPAGSPAAAVIPQPTLTTHTTRLFIKESVIKPLLFTYIVPTCSEKTAHLKAWTQTSQLSSKTDKHAVNDMQLLNSRSGRIFIGDTFAGTTSVQASQPGSPVRLDLGLDKNIQLQSAAVLPHKDSRSEDKSTWFVTDKVKYLVENVEYAFSVHSSYDEPHLVLMSEYVPHVGEEGIKVELLQPPAKTIQSVIVADGKEEGAATATAEGDVWSEEEFLAAVLAHPYLQSPTATATDSKNNKGTQMLSFMSKSSGNLVWAKWMMPGETAKARLQYKIIWPEGRHLAKHFNMAGGN